jgi:hypothetical protein
MKRRLQAHRGVIRKGSRLLILVWLPSAVALCQVPASGLSPALSANFSASSALKDSANSQVVSSTPASASAYRAGGRTGPPREHTGLQSAYEAHGKGFSSVQPTLKPAASSSRFFNRSAPLSLRASTSRFGSSQSHASTLSIGFPTDWTAERSTPAATAGHSTGVRASNPLLSAILRESRGVGPRSPSALGHKGIIQSQDPRRQAIKSLLGINSLQTRR